jgi:DNA-directed RNA polymerase specialized sigma24 family protein
MSQGRAKREREHAMIESADWRRLLPKLIRFARARTTRSGWWGAAPHRLPAGVEPVDFVHEAIAKLLSGERSWPSDRVALFPFLCGVISGLVSHAAKPMTPIAIEAPRIDHVLVAMSMAAHAQIDARLPHADERDRILEALRADPIASKMARLIIDLDLDKPRMIAAALGVSVEEVYKARKRIQRRLLEERAPRQVDRSAA